MRIKLFRKLRRKFRLRKRHGSKYYFQQNLIKDRNDLVLILDPLPGKEVIKSEKTFLFNGIPLGEITRKSMKSELGSPAYILWNDENIPKHKVYFYREYVRSYKFLIQYHFIENKFIFACNRISAHNGLSDEDKQEVVKQLLLKYTDRNPEKPNDNLQLKLTDKNGNIISTTDTVYFLVNYLPNNEHTRHLIKKFGLVAENNERNHFSKNLKNII